MKKVVLFSALALSVVMLAGCSGKENSSGDTTSKVNSANTESVIVSEPPESKAYDERVQVTDEWRFVYDRKLGGIKIIDCLCAQKRGGPRVYNSVKDIVVPESFEGFEGLQVLEIGERALAHIEDCNSITLPDSLKYIDGYAFASSDIKQPIVIPSGIVDMSEYALGGMRCEVQLPSTLKKISKRLFDGSEITHITIPSSVEVIEEGAFYQCELTEITIGDGVKAIEPYAFGNCFNLKSVSFNNDLEEIGDYAFYSCSELETVTFGNSLKKIGREAFYGCNKLTKQTVTLPDTLTSIGSNAFTTGLGSLNTPIVYKGNSYSIKEIYELIGTAE